MNAAPFYLHESDSRIMRKKDRIELSIWMEHLEFIGEELKYLHELENRIVHDHPLFLQLQQIRRESALKSARLYRYELSMRNSLECDDLQCDAYYLHNHERHRALYMEFVRDFRAFKKKLFVKLLNKAGRK